uniref:BTB domain-containing protein n=1 Tax=Culex tarsalis TaxID=7177 RepID=A0A1Q3F3F6_CULTA
MEIISPPKPENGAPEVDQQNPSFTTRMAACDRLDLLVNNELFADVVFSVGSEGTLMFGHKAILTMASDVFRAQFTGSFRESRENGQEHEILVIDIEPPVFKEILRYAYCDRVRITAGNVLHLLYAAEKYLLAKLTKECNDFVEKHLCEKNVLRMFDQNRSYELEDINRKCLEIISANPILMFGDEHFLTLDSKSLELIAECKRMNCHLSHLLGAIEAWLKINEHDADRGNEIRDKVLKFTKLEHMCKNIQNFSASRYQLDIKTEMFVETENNTKKTFFIYGIGIPLKMKNMCSTPETVHVDITIARQIRNIGTDLSPVIIKRLSVPVDTFMQVKEIMFVRQKIDCKTMLNVQIRINNIDQPMLVMENFTSDQPDVGLRFKVRKENTTNCVAYVLYDEGNDIVTTWQNFFFPQRIRRSNRS